MKNFSVNMTNLRKEIYLILAIIIFFILYLNRNKINFIWNKFQILSKGNEINEMLTQNMDKAKMILNAFKKQKQGLILIRNDNSSITNYTATLANIPIQFNVC